MESIRKKLRAIILAITAIIEFILVLRIVFDLVGAVRTNVIVASINSLTDFLIAPLKGTFTLPTELTIKFLNLDAIVAIIFYALIGIFFAELVTALIRDRLEEIVDNLLDIFFRTLEVLLTLRILLAFFNLANTSAVSKAIFSLTEFSQVVPLKIQLLSSQIDVSAIIVLIIVVILDALSESFVKAIFKEVKVVKTKVIHNSPAPIAPKPTPQTQNIIINVPLPPQQQRPQVTNVNLTPSGNNQSRS